MYKILHFLQKEKNKKTKNTNNQSKKKLIGMLLSQNVKISSLERKDAQNKIKIRQIIKEKHKHHHLFSLTAFFFVFFPSSSQVGMMLMMREPNVRCQVPLLESNKNLLSDVAAVSG